MVVSDHMKKHPSQLLVQYSVQCQSFVWCSVHGQSFTRLCLLQVMSPQVLPTCKFQPLTLAVLCGPTLLQNQGHRPTADETSSLPSASLAVGGNTI